MATPYHNTQSSGLTLHASQKDRALYNQIYTHCFPSIFLKRQFFSFPNISSLWYFSNVFHVVFFFFLVQPIENGRFLELKVKDHRMSYDRKDLREYLLQYFHFICVEIAASRGKVNFQRPSRELKVYCVITRMIWFLIQSLFCSFLMT